MQPSLDGKCVVDRLIKFQGTSLLKKAALNWLVKMTDQQEIESLREQFQRIDTDNSGLISLDELKQAIQSSGVNISSTELERIIIEVDFHGNHEINYQEFLAATIEDHYFDNEQSMKALFNYFDTDHTG